MKLGGDILEITCTHPNLGLMFRVSFSKIPIRLPRKWKKLQRRGLLLKKVKNNNLKQI